MTLAQIIKTMVHFDTLKIYGANAIAFLSTLTTLDIYLKRALIMASLAYTIVKIWQTIKKDNDMEYPKKKKKKKK